MKAEGTYSTGEVATICKVAPRTAAGWIDKGLLVGYRIPGSGGARRVTRAALEKFIKDNGLPFKVPDEEKASS